MKWFAPSNKSLHLTSDINLGEVEIWRLNKKGQVFSPALYLFISIFPILIFYSSGVGVSVLIFFFLRGRRLLGV
jgi:hypothetical protein